MTRTPLADLLDRCPPEAADVLQSFIDDAISRFRPPDDPARATAVLRTYLRHARAGIALTKGGRVAPAAVVALMAELDSDQQWIGKANREDWTPVIGTLRQASRSLGLTRHFKGRVILTREGAARWDKPDDLWARVASRLPVERSDAGLEVGIILMSLVAVGDVTRDRRSLGEAVTEAARWAGWSVPDIPWHHPMLDVVDLTVSILEWAGSGQLLGRGGIARTNAQQLARAAITYMAIQEDAESS